LIDDIVINFLFSKIFASVDNIRRKYIAMVRHVQQNHKPNPSGQTDQTQTVRLPTQPPGG